VYLSASGVDDATSDAEQRAAAGVLHHWTTDLLSLYSPALTLHREHRERYMQLPHKVPRAAYCSSNNASALDLCISARKQQNNIASNCVRRAALAIRSILDLTSPLYTQRASASRERRAWNAFGKLAMNLNSPVATICLFKAVREKCIARLTNKINKRFFLVPHV
jgi:hypothetical protein